MSKKNKHENEVVEEELLTAEKETTIDETNADIDPLEELKSNLEKEKDRNLRLFAEFENFKKRTSRERIELFSTASEGVMVSLLPVLDDFERGIQEMKKSDDNALLQYYPMKARESARQPLKNLTQLRLISLLRS